MIINMSQDLSLAFPSAELWKKCLLKILKIFEIGIFYTMGIFKNCEVEFYFLDSTGPKSNTIGNPLVYKERWDVQFNADSFITQFWQIFFELQRFKVEELDFSHSAIWFFDASILSSICNQVIQDEKGWRKQKR